MTLVPTFLGYQKRSARVSLRGPATNGDAPKEGIDVSNHPRSGEMYRRLILNIAVALAVTLAASGAIAQSASVPQTSPSVPAAAVGVHQTKTAAPLSESDSISWVPQFTLAAVCAFFLAGVLASIRTLRKDKDWSLGQALSEKADAPAAQQAAGVGQASVASTSRLIAFLGMLGMLSVFMGLGLYLLWALFEGKAAEAVDAVKAVGPYLLYGSSLYAPYAFNQIKEAFKP